MFIRVSTKETPTMIVPSSRRSDPKLDDDTYRPEIGQLITLGPKVDVATLRALERRIIRDATGRYARLFREGPHVTNRHPLRAFRLVNGGGSRGRGSNLRISCHGPTQFDS